MRKCTFTQSKVFLIAVEKRYVGAGSSDVNNTIVVGCKIYSIVCTDTVTRVQYNTVGNGSEEGEIFQGHLTWPVLADATTRVRTNELKVGATYACNANLIGSSTEESTKG